jgi:RNA-dependent RNA polymerase
MAARIGQGLSSCWGYELYIPPNVEIIPDIYTPNGLLFTDGIGKISEDLLDNISLKLNISNISVIKIHYRGAKGLLTLDTTLPKNTICLRQSMIKYKCKHNNSGKYLDILSWNINKSGFLNR